MQLEACDRCPRVSHGDPPKNSSYPPIFEKAFQFYVPILASDCFQELNSGLRAYFGRWLCVGSALGGTCQVRPTEIGSKWPVSEMSSAMLSHQESTHPSTRAEQKQSLGVDRYYRQETRALDATWCHCIQ